MKKCGITKALVAVALAVGFVVAGASAASAAVEACYSVRVTVNGADAVNQGECQAL